MGNREKQGAVAHLAGLGAHLGWFHINELFFFQPSIVFCNRVGAHPGVLTNASDAGPAPVRFPVLTENQVCVDGQLTGGKSQSENLIRQKEIMS